MTARKARVFMPRDVHIRSGPVGDQPSTIVLDFGHPGAPKRVLIGLPRSGALHLIEGIAQALREMDSEEEGK